MFQAGPPPTHTHTKAESVRMWAQKHPFSEAIVSSIFQAVGMGSRSLAGSLQSWACPCPSLCLSYQVGKTGLWKGAVLGEFS